MKNELRKCKFCTFFESGCCMRHPSSVQANKDDWCGEFVADLERIHEAHEEDIARVYEYFGSSRK